MRRPYPSDLSDREYASLVAHLPPPGRGRPWKHLAGWLRLSLQIRCCTTYGCGLFDRPYRPEVEGGYVLPHGEIGLDVIASVGAQRFGQHRSVPEIHRDLQARHVAVCERSVTNLVQR